MAAAISKLYVTAIILGVRVITIIKIVDRIKNLEMSVVGTLRTHFQGCIKLSMIKYQIIVCLSHPSPVTLIFLFLVNEDKQKPTKRHTILFIHSLFNGKRL